MSTLPPPNHTSTALNFMDEPKLVKVYSELTGASDSTARSVFMHLELRSEETVQNADITATDSSNAAQATERTE